MVLGVAATALALTGCGAAVSNSGGALGVHVARVAARNASMGTSVIALEDLAGVKRHMTSVAGYFAQRPQVDPPGFPDLRNLAKVKRAFERHAVQQARGR
jgi:hypothetical protein